VEEALRSGYQDTDQRFIRI